MERTLFIRLFLVWLLIAVPLQLLLDRLIADAVSPISCVDAGAVELATADPTDPQTISYPTPAGSNQILFVGVGQRVSPDQAMTVTHAGNAMALTRASIWDDPSGAQLWYLVNPTAGTNDVVINYTTGAPLDAGYIIWTCSGVNTAAPFHDANSAAGNSTTASVTVANLVAGDMVVDFMTTDDAAEPAEGANQTVIHKITGGSLAVAASFQDAADGGVMSWTITLDDWAIQAVALTPAVSTRRPIPPLFLGN